MRPPYSFSRALLLAVMFIWATAAARAQAPVWQSAVASASAVHASVTDASGNIYVLDDSGLSKWNPITAAVLWMQPAKGTALFVSGGNIYVAGTFRGPFTIGTTTLPGIGGSDIFVAKFTTAGTFVWAQQAGGIDNDTGASIAVTGTRVYVAGTATGTTTFGTVSLANSPSRQYAYVAKLDDTGASASFTWAEGATGATAVFGEPKLAENGTSVYLAGRFTGTTGFGGLTVANPSAPDDFFVFKLVDTGPSPAFTWGTQVGGTVSGGRLSLAASGSGVYLAGDFYGSIAFNNTRLSTAGTRGLSDVFLTKITDAGASASFTWILRAGGDDDDVPAYSPIVVSGANIYLTGTCGSATADFGATVLTNTGSNNMFIAKVSDLGTSGRFAWAQKARGVSNNDGAVVALGPNGRLYVAGNCGPSTSFGSTTLTGPVNTQIHYFASLTDPTLTAITPVLTAASVALFPNPAHGRATIQLPTIPGTATATLTLLDALGRTLRTQTAVPNARAELDLTGLPTGLYAVRVQAGGSTATRRLVVE